MIAFAHGSGSRRLSPRNTFVATFFRMPGWFHFWPISWRSGKNRIAVIDIDLLAGRLAIITEWLKASSETSGLEIGYFGASTGAAAAHQTAVQRKMDVTAVVSRDRRPDLVMDYLSLVAAPTLLLV